MSSLASYALTTLVGLGVLALLGTWVARAGRRAGWGPRTGPLSVVASVSLDPRRTVYAIRVADRVHVVLVTEAGATVLTETSAAEFPEGSAQPTSLPAWLDRTALGRLLAAPPRSEQ